MKKRTFLCIFLISISFTLYAMGAGLSDEESLGTFDSVSIGIPAETIIQKGSRTSLDIDMSDRTARNVEIRNDRGNLVIKSRHGAWIRKSENIKIRITMPYFNTLKLSSSGTIHSEDDWNGDIVQIKTNGSGDISLNSLRADKILCKISGSGNIQMKALTVTGEAELSSTGSGNLMIDSIDSGVLSIDLTGSGDFRGGLRSNRLEMHISGSGDAELSGTTQLAELRTTGSGQIDGGHLTAGEAYIRITGSGDVSLKDGSHLKEIKMTGSGTFRSL